MLEGLPRRVLGLLLALVCTAATAARGADGSAPGPAPGGAPLDDENLVVLEVRLGGYLLSEGIVGYLYPGSLLLPLGELAEALDFAIVVEAYDSLAHGWFIREQRGFRLDLSRNEVVVAGHRSGFDPELVTRDQLEIFVDTSLLARWFDLEFEILLHQMSVRVESAEPLPIQQRLRREERRARVLSHRLRRPALPTRSAPYRKWSWPFVELSLSGDSERGASQLSYSLLSAFDLAGLSTQTFLSGSASGLSNLRMYGSRKDPTAGLLGPLRARTVEFGDVVTLPIPLVAHPRQGVGLMISNAPLGQADEFASTAIRGDALPGWEVELYHNEALLDFVTVGDSGRYEFPDVEIGYGENIVRTVAYGPQGQVRERVERFQIGSEMSPPGTLEYRLFASSPGHALAERWVPELSNAEAADTWDLHGRVDYGVGRHLSLGGGLARIALADRIGSYATLSVRSAFRGFFTQADLAQDLAGGSAAQLSTRTRFRGISLLLQQSIFRGYLSGEDSGGTPRRSETRLRVAGTLDPPGLRWLAYNLQFERDRFADQNRPSRDRAAFRLASQLGRVNVSHELGWERSGGAQGGELGGALLATGRLRGVQLRGRLDYRWSPVPFLEGVSAGASWRPRRQISAILGIRHTRGAQSDTVVTANLSWLARYLAIGVELSRGSVTGARLGLSLSFAVGRDPGSGKWIARSTNLATSTSAVARVYVDHNANDIFDAGDEPLSGVRFLGSHEWSEIATDGDGRASLFGIPPSHPKDVRIDLSTLIDPYWLPAVKGYSVMGHRGGTAELDFPVRVSGEIEGTVWLERRGERGTKSGARVELVDEAGDVVDRALSEFDGYFVFQRILPGRYRLRIARSRSAAGLELPDPLEVEVPSDGGVVAGVSLILRVSITYE